MSQAFNDVVDIRTKDVSTHIETIIIIKLGFTSFGLI